MKTKHNAALLETLYLSNDIKERIPKSCETIPLNHLISILLNLIIQLNMYVMPYLMQIS
jgi:hypothetical protein